MQYDIVIIGAGVAGLYASMQFSSDKKVLIINKAYPWECNTYYAQGGISTARNKDDINIHVQDTLIAGASLCNEKAVRVMSENSLQVIDDLIQNGFEFDKDEDGNLLYTKEAAHSTERILHAGGDATGRYLHHFLLKSTKHPMLADTTVIDLIFEDDRCIGVLTSTRGKQKAIYANNIIIASGGVGSLFDIHTNAKKISGELQGIAKLHNIELEMMEMTQFHPTVFVSNSNAQKLLLTEALRGEGAKIEDESGYRFLKDYHKDEELAPRDVVSRAIFSHAKNNSTQVYLNFENFSKEYFQKRFPNINEKFKSLGFNVPEQRVPISPAFHYSIGGIKTDLNGKVLNKKNLYAIGEVASTGVHGANRLASNSLLEGLVFALLASKEILKDNQLPLQKNIVFSNKLLFIDGDIDKKNQLRDIMWHNVAIERTTEGLLETLEFINKTLNSEIGWLLKLRLITAKEIVQSAIKRKKSIGVHFIKES